MGEMPEAWEMGIFCLKELFYKVSPNVNILWDIEMLIGCKYNL